MMNAPRPASRGRQFAQSYAQIGLETEVMSASPEKLISLLLNGARASINKAKLYMEIGDVPNRGAAISKAINIVTQGLRASVDESVGEVGKSLVMSYDLISHHLLLANLHSKLSHLEVAEKMLVDISSAWQEATGQAA